jgi:hypothetical protein
MGGFITVFGVRTSIFFLLVFHGIYKFSERNEECYSTIQVKNPCHNARNMP